MLPTDIVEWKVCLDELKEEKNSDGDSIEYRLAIGKA